MQLIAVEDTELFTGTAEDPHQVLRVRVSEPTSGGRVLVTGPGVHGEAGLTDAGAVADVEVGLTGLPAAGTVQVTVQLVDADSTPVGAPVEHAVQCAEPGWTVWMVPHFHYDPVWWNTQAAYTYTWDEAGDEAQRFRMAFQQTGFALVALHLQTARRDPDYKFVLAEVDYLKPYWDAHPGDRAYLRTLLAEGRLEIMGGTYNEPNTNLTSAESTARNFVYGVGFQRDILGGDPQTAWQLDVFGHDPQFPGMAADAGLTSSSWARGPFHQWGPMLWTHAPQHEGWGDPAVMQFPAEFDWVSPSGHGVLTHYMPAHYSAGWQIDSQTDLAGAEHAAYHLFTLLKRVAATRNVLLPVGTDYTPPSKWVTEIHRDWSERYVWPRMRCALPSEFFAAVRSELAAEGRSASAQTRDMNPIYTGKDVSYIDTKQAQRQAESLLLDAEKFATLAMRHGAGYPQVAMDKAWRQLVFGAHHDAITGSESDQVYIDLLTGWREAHDVGRQVLATALTQLSDQIRRPDDAGAADQLVTVFNPSSWPRTDLVSVPVVLDAPGPAGLVVLDPDGVEIASVLDHVHTHPGGGLASATVTFIATAPGVGYSSGWRIRGTTTPSAGWIDVEGEPVISSAAHRIAVDPERGGTVVELTDLRTGRPVLRGGGLGNELLIHQEYPEHPRFHEGPWHLVPKGIAAGSGSRPADSVRVQRSPVGERIVVTGSLGALRYEQHISLFHDVDRVDCATYLDGFDGADELIRLKWPVDVPGALPVSEVGDAVVGRGFAHVEADSADHPWTLDNPANNWFGVSSTARVRIVEGDSTAAVDRAIGIAELIGGNGAVGDSTRALAVALVGQGVTATSSRGDGPRYGKLEVDSNLPDVRIALGGPDTNDFVAARLAAADPQYRLEIDKQLAESGQARVWIPAAVPLAEAWVPSADLSDPTMLPVLVLVGDGAVQAVVEDLSDATVEVRQHAAAETPGEPGLVDYTVGLLNQGVPGFAVDVEGALHLSLLRSCTGWPSGVWIDAPRRTALDGSNFQQEHWSHRFHYSLRTAAGDWRAAGLVQAGHDYNHPLYAEVRPAGTSVAGASQPSEQTLFSVEPAGDVVLAALKPRGNALARGRGGPAESGLTARLYEAGGRQRQARLQAAWPLTGGIELDLLEQPRPAAAAVGHTDGALTVELAPMQISTVGTAAPQSAPDTAAYGSQHEPHQPVYTRYWLNNTGPAPRGNVPVTVHLDPVLAELPASSQQPVPLTVTVASNHTDVAVSGSVDLGVPAGWAVDDPSWDYTLQPGGHLSRTVTVHPDPGSPAGTHWVTATITHHGQRFQDVCRVVLGGQQEPELSVQWLQDGISLRPGDSGELSLLLTSTARTPISAQVQLIGPWPTWEMVADWDTGTGLDAGGSATVRFPVTVPPAARPGSWWVLAKVAAAGMLHYTEPIALEVPAGGAR